MIMIIISNYLLLKITIIKIIMLINLDNCYKKMDTGSLPELQSLEISQKSPVN